MLSRLVIKNIALIDELIIDFTGDMNVLSGETGAGKSIIVDSVNLALGERADRELIRTGAQNASVEAWFSKAPGEAAKILSEQQIEAIGEIVISRELSVTGKNICRINGILVSLTLLKSISDILVDMHGQHEHQSLFNEKNHIEMLDSFGERIEELKDEVGKAYFEYTAVNKRLRSIFGAEGDRERKIDILKFQISEIKQANIKKGEEEELAILKKRMNASEEIMGALSSSYDSLYNAEPLNVLSALKDISGKLKPLSRLDAKYDEIAAKVDDAYYSLDEITSDIRTDMDSFNFDPKELEETEERLAHIGNLKRKYGDPAADGEFIIRAEQELSDLVDSERLEKELTVKSEELKRALYEKSVKLSNLRRETAAVFREKMMEQLADLGMSSATFSVDFHDTPPIGECSFTDSGIDTAEFYISTNKGEPEKPLRKIASGGEISRIMLALKNISADRGGIPTMIFDEIDTGISGRIAQVVAEKLQAISRNRQVICVTHLPQIACMADRHFMVSKTSDENSTKTNVTILESEERISEIARLSGGDSQAAKEHAREMLKNAAGFKVST
jgi:DNA repair protein RecN (Recombination protein N)